MELWLKIVIGVGSAAALGLLIYLWLGVYVAKQKNAYCRLKAGKQCEAMARRGGHILLHDLKLPLDGKTVKIDHLVVGTYGVVMVNGYDGHGDLYGSSGDKNWYFYEKDNKNKKTISNPMTRMEEGVRALRQVFAKAGVYNVSSIDCFIVFGNGVKLNVTRTDKDMAEVLLLKQLSKPLHREKYLFNAKTDPQKAAQALQAANHRQSA